MARRAAPFVAVRTDIRKEERVRFIADHAGYNDDEAIGKLVRMWSWCTDRGLEDAPDDCDGYAVPDAVVLRFLGPRGVAAILGDGCDELAMGARRHDGLIQLREGAISGLGSARDQRGPVARMVTYAIASPCGSHVKIGRTEFLGRRLTSLQTAHHAPISLVGFVAGDIEATVHVDLDALGKRARGEWFVFDSETRVILVARGMVF